MSVQNCSAAPTPVEFPLTSGVVKSSVVDPKSGAQSEQGYARGDVGADVENRSRQFAKDWDVGVADGAVDVVEDVADVADVVDEDEMDESLAADVLVGFASLDLVRREVHRPTVSAARQRMVSMIPYYSYELVLFRPIYCSSPSRSSASVSASCPDF